MSDKLDYMLMASMRKESGINILEASTFVLGLRKMAQDAAPIDITGTIEGQFTVPLDQAVGLMAQMVSNEFKTQAYYVYYGNMLRGTDRAGIAEEFEDHAKEELVHANYLLRRIGVLSPGGISIPPYPPPRPLYNSQQIIREMIVVEQIGLSLWKQLHSILGDNPMKYTVEQFLQTEEAHQDELWQFLDPMAPEQQMDEVAAMPEAPKTAAEIFTAAALRKQAGIIAADSIDKAKWQEDPLNRHIVTSSIKDTLHHFHQKGLLTPEGEAEHKLHMSPVGHPDAVLHLSHFKPEAHGAVRDVHDKHVESKFDGLGAEEDLAHALERWVPNMKAAAAEAAQAGKSVLSEHSDHPGSMMVSNLKRLADQSKQLSAAVSVQDNAEPWVESKIDRASEGIDAVHDYMKYKSEKKASHALSADEMSAAGWDRSRAGKKEHSVKEAQAAQSMGKPTVPEHDELVRAGMDRRKKAMIHTASDNSEGAMDRDRVIKDKARELMAKATSGYRSLADMIHHKDQARTEVTPMDPAALQKQQAPFVVKKHPAAVRPQDPENHTPVPMRGPLPMPKQASLGDLVLKSASFAPRKTHEYDTLGGRKEIGLGHRDTLGGWVPDSAPSESGMIGKLLRMRSASGAAKIADMIVPNPGADNPEAYVMREQQLIAQQAQGEAAHQKAISAQASQAAQQAQAEAQAAQQQLQEMQQQLQDAQQQAEQAQQQQSQSAQQAAEAEARAADHSIQKMQLGMRVNQLRQSLANLVMQDPVSENSGTVSDLAATGQPATPQQQQEAEAQQQQASAAPASADTQQQAVEAQSAQQEAEVQAQQAQQAQQMDQMKQSGFVDSAFESLTPRMEEAARRAARAGTDAQVTRMREHASNAIAQYGKPALGAAAATALLGGIGLHKLEKRQREHRKQDVAEAVAEGIRRSKLSALADRNMAAAIHAMEAGPLRDSLMGVVRSKIPGTAAQAAVQHAAQNAVGQVAHEGGKALSEGAPALMAKLAPHLPGFAVGAGTTLLGLKMLGNRNQASPQQTSPLTYAQYYSGQE